MSCRVTPSASHRPARISSAVRRSRRISSAGTASRTPAGRGDSKRGGLASFGFTRYPSRAKRARCRGAVAVGTCLSRQAVCRRTSEDRHKTSCGDMHCRRRTYHAMRALLPGRSWEGDDATSGRPVGSIAELGGAASPADSDGRPDASSRMAGAHTLGTGLTSKQAVVDGQVMRLLMAPRQLLLDPAPARGTHASPPGLVIDQIDEQAGHLFDVVREWRRHLPPPPTRASRGGRRRGPEVRTPCTPWSCSWSTRR